jgi:ethanolamine-phosphate cytidylyltransferase
VIGRILRIDPKALGVEVREDPRAELAGQRCDLATYLPSTMRICQFSGPPRELTPDDRVVYVQGVFDLIHAGHVAFIEKAKALGPFMVVGVLDDAASASALGEGFPILSAQERLLMLLALRYVDDVVIVKGVAFTQQMLYQVDPAVVAVGSPDGELAGEDFAIAERLGIVVRLPNEHPELSAKKVAIRVLENYELYVAKNKKKEAECPDILRLPSVSGSVKPA